MILNWLVASLHLLALPLGLGGVWLRSRELARPLDAEGLRRVFAADNAWGIAALLWLSSGLWRAFGGLEKGTLYYLHQPVFHIKMGLFVIVVLLEAWPMATLIGWRSRVRRGEPVDTAAAAAMARVGRIEALLVVLIVLAATALARGTFAP